MKCSEVDLISENRQISHPLPINIAADPCQKPKYTYLTVLEGQQVIFLTVAEFAIAIVLETKLGSRQILRSFRPRAQDIWGSAEMAIS